MTDDLKKHQYQLVAGKFEADQAREVLISLIDNKIDFNERKEFSHQERFGETAPGVLERIEQLKQTRHELNALLEKALQGDQMLSVNCTIEISFSPDQ